MKYNWVVTRWQWLYIYILCICWTSTIKLYKRHGAYIKNKEYCRFVYVSRHYVHLAFRKVPSVKSQR